MRFAERGEELDGLLCGLTLRVDDLRVAGPQRAVRVEPGEAEILEGLCHERLDGRVYVRHSSGHAVQQLPHLHPIHDPTLPGRAASAPCHSHEGHLQPT
jgi:hypothetical protein